MIQPLSIVWDFNPVFFSIGSLDIRYYGLMWALAILIGAKFFDSYTVRWRRSSAHVWGTVCSTTRWST